LDFGITFRESAKQCELKASETVPLGGKPQSLNFDSKSEQRLNNHFELWPEKLLAETRIQIFDL
jgi:hypothetical protein